MGSVVTCKGNGCGGKLIGKILPLTRVKYIYTGSITLNLHCLKLAKPTKWTT